MSSASARDHGEALAAVARALNERLAAVPPRLEAWRRRLPVLFWTTIVLAGMLTASITLVGATVGYDYVRADVPPVGAAAIQSPTVVLDASGDTLAKLDPATVGTRVRSADLPDHVVHAVLAAEDRDYFGHGGVSLSSTLRAALANLRSGRVEQGASTLTQQYVDLTTAGNGRSVRDKMREAAAALRVDDELSKQEVLDRYLNVVPFGRDAVGLDAAAQVYFRVPAQELDVNQAATLAGMIAAPSAFDPEANPAGARRRRGVVLHAMADQGWLEPGRADRIADRPLPELASAPLVQYGDAGYVVDAVRRTLRDELDVPLERGLVVHTTIDGRMQRLAQGTVRQHVGEAKRTAAVVSVDPATGAVRALVGGSDYSSENFNAAIRAQRQPGSAFKPFTLAALVDAGYAPDRSRFEAPAELDVPGATDAVTVANFGHEAFGELTVRQATEHSVNTVYMQMVEEVGPQRVVDLAHEMGVDAELPPVPSIALGTGAVTPYELASAYATFAAGGVHRTPRVVASVETTDGEVLYEADVAEHRAVSTQVAGVVTDVLQDVVAAGTGRAAALEGHPVAGKTGTTDSSRDAWFAGFTPQLATVVWVGRADNGPMDGATGGTVAAPLWHDYMQQAMAPLGAGELPVAGQDGLRALDRTRPDPPPPAPEPEPEPKHEPKPEPKHEKKKDPGKDKPKGKGGKGKGH